MLFRGFIALAGILLLTAQVFAQGIYVPLSNSKPSGNASSFGAYHPSVGVRSSTPRPTQSSMLGTIARRGAGYAGELVVDGATEKLRRSNPSFDYRACQLKAAGSCLAGYANAKFDSLIAAGQGKSAGFSREILREAALGCKQEFNACTQQHRQQVLRYCLEQPKAASLYFDCKRELKEARCLQQESLQSLLRDPSDTRSCLERHSELLNSKE